MTDARPETIVRPCFQQDLELVQLIYGHHVLTGTGSFETEPPSLEEMTARWSRVVQRDWPFVVACPAADMSRIVGFAYAQQYRDRPAYDGAFEVSVYTAPTSLRRGIGAALLRDLLLTLQRDGARSALAFIGDSANAASIALHAKLGFRHVGTLKDVGVKFGKSLDVVIMQRSIPRPHPAP
ncbi:MAG: GNAT family N-acetyltransferase [Hyphomonadaceae bacterium]|nr:GNAT family N-acetyltransferase [Hyphomonadaceae bacterium]